MKSTGHFIILLQARTTAQNLGQPELRNGAFHVANLALCGGGSLDPLGGFPTDTAYHVGMSKGFWSTLGRLGSHRRGNRLSDARMERRSAAGRDERALGLIASGRAVVAGGRTDERRAISQRRRHFDGGPSSMLLSSCPLGDVSCLFSFFFIFLLFLDCRTTGCTTGEQQGYIITLY